MIDCTFLKSLVAFKNHIKAILYLISNPKFFTCDTWKCYLMSIMNIWTRKVGSKDLENNRSFAGNICRLGHWQCLLTTCLSSQSQYLLQGYLELDSCFLRTSHLLLRKDHTKRIGVNIGRIDTMLFQKQVLRCFWNICCVLEFQKRLKVESHSCVLEPLSFGN